MQPSIGRDQAAKFALVAEKGKIKLVREGMNSAEVARAVFQQGIPELPQRADDDSPDARKPLESS